MELFNYWIYGVVVMSGLAAWRIPHDNVRNIFVLSLIWPFTIVFALMIALLTLIGWDFDVNKGTKFFSIRRPDDGWTGFAISLFKVEFQFWKTRG